MSLPPSRQEIPGGISTRAQRDDAFPQLRAAFGSTDTKTQFPSLLWHLTLRKGVRAWGRRRRDAGEDRHFYSKTSLPCPTLPEESSKKLALFVGSRKKKKKKSNITARWSLPAVGVRERAASEELPQNPAAPRDAGSRGHSSHAARPCARQWPANFIWGFVLHFQPEFI